jgi:hypothetical protein
MRILRSDNLKTVDHVGEAGVRGRRAIYSDLSASWEADSASAEKFSTFMDAES